MAEAVPAEILEGFLCPMCLKDQGTIIQLQIHFETNHSDETDQDTIRAIKDFIGKAKKKILKSGRDGFEENSSPGNSGRKYEPVAQTGYLQPCMVYESSPMGPVRSHHEYFHQVRSTRLERTSAETNQLIIRLHKLMVDLPTDPVKRKGHERNIVPWLDDSSVNLCPNCAHSFNITRRKHHCRLCGAIMCQVCSRFLAIEDGVKLTSPIESEVDTSSPRKPSLIDRSLVGPLMDIKDSHIRICPYCMQKLEQRSILLERRSHKPILSQFYDRLQSHKLEARDLCTLYHQMAESLYNGDSKYKLNDAKELKVKLLRLAEIIDSQSKSILVLGMKGPEGIPCRRAVILQQKIRSASVTFLKDYLFGLPNLPTESELDKIREKRRYETHLRIEIERSRNSPKKELRIKEDSKHKRSSSSGSSDSSGWRPQTVIANEEDDPMLQQINNINSYIKQARDAHKYDEVHALEANLKELKQAYQEQKSLQKS